MTITGKTAYAGRLALGAAAAFAIGYLATPALDLRATGGVAAAFAGQDDGEQRRSRRSQTISPRVGQALTEINDALTAEDFATAAQLLGNLLNRSNLSPFERATALQMRAAVEIEAENYEQAVRTYEEIIALDAFELDRINSLRFNLGQLYAALENWPAAIENLETYLASIESRPESVLYVLAMAYVQQGDFQTARRYAEEAIAVNDAKDPPEAIQSRFVLLNFIYSELNLDDLRLPLVERMVRLWPDRKNYWMQLSSLYAQQPQDEEEGRAFAVVELAYHSGLLDQESEFTRLAQYYSFYNNPYRGAQMLEREMEAGNVERNADNVELLARTWFQAREHDRAVPVLQEAARLKDDGELYYQLGQTLFAREEWSEAIDALQEALERSEDLSRNDIGQCYFLIGNSRYNLGQRDLARTAFENAARYEQTRTAANGWLQFIQGEIRSEQAQARIAEEIRRQEAARDERRRLETERARRLLGLDPIEDDSDEDADPPNNN